MAASNTNTTRLNAAIASLERLGNDLKTFQGQSKTKLQLLYNENKLLKTEIAHLKAETKEMGEHTSWLEERVGIVYIDDHANGMAETKLANNDVARSTHDGDKEEEETLKASDSALKTKLFCVSSCIPVDLFVN